MNPHWPQWIVNVVDWAESEQRDPWETLNFIRARSREEVNLPPPDQTGTPLGGPPVIH